MNYIYKSLLKLKSNRSIKNFITLLLCSVLIISSNLYVFYFNNFEVSLKELFYSNFELFILTFAIFFCVKTINQKILFFVPLGIILFFQYWNLFEFIGDVSKVYILAGIFIAWFLSVIFLWKKELNELRNINLILTLVIIFGSVFELTAIFKKESAFENKNVLIDKKTIPNISIEDVESTLPNIIYIVPDRYSGINQLQKYYDFDNSDFYNSLKSRGFLISPDSRSNYPFSYASLASTLNSSYLNNNVNLDKRAAHSYIKNSSAFVNIKSLGYEFKNYDNWWNGTQDISIADSNYFRNNKILSKISYDFLFFNTPIIHILSEVSKSLDTYNDCKGIIKKFDSLKKEVSSKGSGLFIFAHFNVPHPPYLLKANGKCNEAYYNENQNFEESKNDYIEYLIYANQRLLDIFDEINENNDNFIFVIQSDEGSYPDCFANGHESCNNEDWDLKTGNINAFYYSKSHELSNKDFLTPINNFSNIFELIGNEDILKKPHKIFIPTDVNKAFNFREIDFND